MKTWFERAIFLSWYCAKGDCAFCYMSTQKKLINNPKKARRNISSILAEVLLCKKLCWEIEFLSGGYESYSTEELLDLIKEIHKIYEKKVWLNVGVLNEDDLKRFKPHIDGVCGAVECVNQRIHNKVCPSKPLKEIEQMFELCDKLKLKKAITIILGLGESLDDFSLLKEFIKKHKINKITFYRLKPQKGTVFEKKEPIESDYYIKWIKKTRKSFLDVKITVGSWLTHLNEINQLLNAGANSITKFPSIKLFNSNYAKQIEKEAKKANREFIGSLTKIPNINWNKEIDKLNIEKKLKEQIRKKIFKYIEVMEKSKK